MLLIIPRGVMASCNPCLTIFYIFCQLMLLIFLSAVYLQYDIVENSLPYHTVDFLFPVWFDTTMWQPMIHKMSEEHQNQWVNMYIKLSPLSFPVHLTLIDRHHPVTTYDKHYYTVWVKKINQNQRRNGWWNHQWLIIPITTIAMSPSKTSGLPTVQFQLLGDQTSPQSFIKSSRHRDINTSSPGCRMAVRGR